MIEEVSEKPEEIEVFPYGISVGAGLGLPVMIFQDAAGEMRIPVCLRPVEATASLAYLDQPSTLPFGMLNQLLDELQVRIEKCVLDEVQGHQQTGVVHLSGPKDWALHSMRRPADELVSVGLVHGSRFFVTSEFAQASREVKVEILESMSEGPPLSEQARRFLM